jgi:hypothetical protein
MHPQAQVVNESFRALRLERSVGAGCLELPSGYTSRMGH